MVKLPGQSFPLPQKDLTYNKLNFNTSLNSRHVIMWGRGNMFIKCPLSASCFTECLISALEEN